MKVSNSFYIAIALWGLSALILVILAIAILAQQSSG